MTALRAFLMVICAVLGAGEAEPVKLPADVQSALDKSEAAVAAVQAKADADIYKIKSALIKDLTKMQEAVTKKGDLKTALAIKDQIDGIKLPDLIDSRPRLDSSKFKTYNAKAWDAFPGELVTVNAEAACTAVTLDKQQEAIILPHPTDQWASHSAGSKTDFRGTMTQRNGMPNMCMLIRVGEGEASAVDTSRVYAGPGAVVLEANENVLSNNIGKIRVKVIVQKKQ